MKRLALAAFALALSTTLATAQTNSIRVRSGVPVWPPNPGGATVHHVVDVRVNAQGDLLTRVLCASGTLVRLRGRAAIAGSVVFPDTRFAQDATTTLSLRGGVVAGSGAVRYYSAWYRNTSSTFCPPTRANVTNGIRVTW